MLHAQTSQLVLAVGRLEERREVVKRVVAAGGTETDPTRKPRQPPARPRIREVRSEDE